MHGQDESYLGISTDEIAFIESQLSTTTFYYIDGVTGQVSVLEIPEIETDDSATIWNILNLVLNVVMIEIGIVLCCTGVGAGLGASLIAGGIIGMVAQYFKDEIGEFINSAIGSDGTQALGGGMSVMMGGVTINIGRNLIGKTGWGTAAGVVCIIVGIALAVFGASEITEVAFDYNFIKELTGISDKAYANLYQALGYASTVIITVYSTLTQFYKKVNALNKKSLKELVDDAIPDGLNSESQIPENFGTGDGLDKYTKNNYRKKLLEATGKTGEGLDAHHVFPKDAKFAKQFERVKINPNHPDNMQWVEQAIHSGKGNISHAYTQEWIKFFDANPMATRTQVIDFGKKMWDYFGGFR